MNYAIKFDWWQHPALGHRASNAVPGIICLDVISLTQNMRMAMLSKTHTYTAVYLGQPACSGTATLRYIIPVCHSYCPQTHHTMPVFYLKPPILPLWSNTKENPVKQLKETRRT